MKKSFQFLGFGLVAFGFFVVMTVEDVVPIASAHSGATGIVKERMDGMKAIASATKTIATLDWASTNAAREKLKQSGEVLSEHASQIVSLFPKGSIKGPSEATSAIWDRPEVFAALAKELETSAIELIAASENATDKASIKPSFDKIAATCKACHSDFRLKK